VQRTPPEHFAKAGRMSVFGKTKASTRTASFEVRFRKGNEPQSGSSYGLDDLAYLELAAKQTRTHRSTANGDGAAGKGARRQGA